MSCTTVMAAFEDGDMKAVAEFRNAWRGAMWIWNEIAKKYCGLESFPMFGEKQKEVWGLADPDTPSEITESDRLALISTLDRFLVSPEYAERVAQALESFEPGTENLKGQAQAIREAVKNGARAVGWYQMSVSDCPWIVPYIGEEADCEKGYRPYNIDKDVKHEWIVPKV